MPAQIEIRQHAIGGGQQGGQEVRLQAHHQHLAFRITKADVVFDELRAFAGDHQSGEQHTLKRRPPLRQSGNRRLDDLRHDAVHHGGCHHGSRRISAHTSGVRAFVAVENLLVILRRAERQHVLAVDEGEHARFLALHELLDHDFRSGRAKTATKASVDGLVRGFAGFGDDDALASRKSVRLDYHREALQRAVGFRLGGIGETSVGGRRDVELAAQILGETLGAFELRRCTRWAEHLEAGCLQIVGDARNQRRLWPNHDEIDLEFFGKPNDRRMIGQIDRHALRDFSNAGVAGRTIQLAQQRTGTDRPCQRVLTPAGTENKHVHALSTLIDMVLNDMANIAVQ